MLVERNMEIVHASSVFVILLCIMFIIPGYQALTNATLDYITTDKSLIGTQNTNSMLQTNQAETHYYTVADSNLNTDSSSEENVSVTSVTTDESTTGATIITTSSASNESSTTVTPSDTTSISSDTTTNTNADPPETTTRDPCKHMSFANITTETVLPTQVVLHVNLNGGENCYPAPLNITCIPNDTWSSVISVKKYTKIINNSTYNLTLDDLSECSYYTCVFEGVPEFITTEYSFKTAESVIYFANITTETVLPTQVVLLVNLKGDENCYPASLNITCTPNDTWPWVNGVKKYAKSMDNPTDYLTLDGLSEFTHYTCVFEVVPGYNTTEYSFTTAEGVPSEPRNLNVTNITSSGFSLTWDPPKKVPTILVGYKIIIVRGNVSSENHYWTGCSDEPDKNFTFYTNKSHFHFYNASADFDYFVSVVSSSPVGTGNSTNTTLSTLVAASGPPDNVTTTITEFPVGNKNIENRLTLSWEMPCNSNGPVNYFVVELSGHYSLNESRIHSNSSFIPVHSTSGPYSYNVTNLMASANYTLQMYAINNSSRSLRGKPYNTTFTTSENYPSAPEEVITIIQAHNFTLHWNEPTNNPGYITEYRVNVTFLGLEWERTESCTVPNREYNETIYQWEREFTATKLIPGSTYNIAIAGETSKGVGNSTNMTITTNNYYPEILNVTWKIDDSAIDGNQYHATVLIEFTPGCFNGKFEHYDISIMGSRMNHFDDYLDKRMNHSTDSNIQECSFSLKPDYFYTVNVSVKNVDFSSNRSVSFTSPSGVPIFNDSIISSIEPVASQTDATITLRRHYFNDSQGDIKYVAIIVSSENVSSGEFHRWDDNSQWPEPDADVDIYYQATRQFWNPFLDADSVDFVIGNDTSCSPGTQFCNGPLQPGKTYFVFVRMFTGNYYRNSSPIKFVTNPLSRLELILGLIFGLLGASTMGFIGLIVWRKGIIKIAYQRTISNPTQRNSNNEIPISSCERDCLIKIANKEESIPETEISKEKFVEYCQYLEHNPDVLNKQWQDLEIKSVEIYEGLEHHFALLPENRRKNRFTNILPFDHTRIKLNIDEDDDISSDYINASYIKGFSTQNEYIATQGPLPHTVRDFWKMIFQENVSIIIMVARFIENKREKCYKYFPNNHETMLFGDDLEVRCSIELHFQIYCIRTLQVRRDERQLTVTHVQFLEWPDFGVPEGTDNLLLFYRQIRDRWATEGGMAVVHCSAGVGRTGTIIATDILIRAMESGKKIDVFNTVLELRRQRKSMVQTEKQYMYIHQLVRSVIEDPLTDDDDSQEHVYQNVDLNTRCGNGLVESAF